jgi:hypothetical protein
MAMENVEQWHLDKKVPIGIFVVLFVQTITLVYVGTAWKADIDHRIGALERTQDQRTSQESRLIVLEQRLGFIEASLKRIEDKINAGDRR